MLTNVNANFVPKHVNYVKQKAEFNLRANKLNNSESFSIDKLEISIDAKKIISQNESDNKEFDVEEFIEKNTGTSSRVDEPEDTKTTEARRKLYAMRISQRIARGDNVPMQDHRFLAEFDSALYKASLKASLTAKNDDPETHESLADELLAIEDAKRNHGSRELEAVSDIEEGQLSEEIDMG